VDIGVLLTALPAVGVPIMKAKLAVAFAVLLSATLARADSTPITVDVTATSCAAACGFPGSPPINLKAVFTVEQVTGTFFDSGQGFLFTGTEYEVVNIAGTLNGGAMTLAAAPQGIGSWMSEESGTQFILGSVYFTANGSFSWLENDVENNLLEIMDANGDGFGTSNPINWTATDPSPMNTPEPSTSLLMVAGIAFVLASGVKTTRNGRQAGSNG